MTRSSGLLLALILLLVSACTGQPTHSTSQAGLAGDDELVLDAIIVLQCEPDREAGRDSANLDEGCQAVNTIIGQYFAMKENVSILSAMQQESLTGTFIGNLPKKARHIGMQAQGDAVLITRLLRYHQLVGKKYGADEPASVSFDYQLIHLASGKPLCRGSYEETQKTLFSDLFSFGKASRRNFEFVSADTLLREGVEQEFGACRHLATP